MFDEIVAPASSTVPDNYTICRMDDPDSRIAVDNIQCFGAYVLINTAEALSYRSWSPSSIPAGIDSLAAGEEREMLTCYQSWYTITGRNIEDTAGNVMQPESSVDLRFQDIYPPELLSIRVLPERDIYLTFGEALASYSATNPGRYSVGQVDHPEPVVEVESVEYLGRFVILRLAGSLAAGETRCGSQVSMTMPAITFPIRVGASRREAALQAP